MISNNISRYYLLISVRYKIDSRAYLVVYLLKL